MHIKACMCPRAQHTHDAIVDVVRRVVSDRFDLSEVAISVRPAQACGACAAGPLLRVPHFLSRTCSPAGSQGRVRAVTCLMSWTASSQWQTRWSTRVHQLTTLSQADIAGHGLMLGVQDPSRHRMYVGTILSGKNGPSGQTRHEGPLRPRGVSDYERNNASVGTWPKPYSVDGAKRSSQVLGIDHGPCSDSEHAKDVQTSMALFHAQGTTLGHKCSAECPLTYLYGSAQNTNTA
jgi:hypothetical protein